MSLSKASVLALLSVAAIEAASHDPWVHVRSTHFELFTTSGERNALDLVHQFEQVRSFFQQAFGLDGANGSRVRIVSFRSDKEYQPYSPTKVADAFFQPGPDHDYIVLKGSSGEVFPVAIHEYTHLLLRQTRREIPRWFSEGLAELYSSLEIRGSSIVVGHAIPGRTRDLLREPWIDLRTLLSVGLDSPIYNQKGHVEMFYAESWALVHMLSLDDRYSPGLRVMMEGLKDGGDAAAAFRKAYGKPVEKVQEDLQSYFTGASFNAAVFDLKLTEPVAAAQVEADATLSARLALAELLSDEKSKVEQARAALKAVSRDYENRWEVEQAWGDFLARERRNNEAAQHYARAAGLGCDDPMLFVHYGRMLNFAGRTADAVAVLKTAVKLDPSSDEGHFELAVAQVRNGAYRDSLPEFHAIKHLGKEHAYRYFYYLAFAHYRVGDVAQARLLIERARAETRNPEEIATLTRLSQALLPNKK